MHLDEGDGDAEQGIAQRDAGVGIGAGIDNDEGHPLATCGMQAIDQGTFAVALVTGELVAAAAGKLGALALEGGQGRAAVDPRLAQTQEIQIRTIDDQQFRHAATA